jgi:hypothetical protein
MPEVGQPCPAQQSSHLMNVTPVLVLSFYLIPEDGIEHILIIRPTRCTNF